MNDKPGPHPPGTASVVVVVSSHLDNSPKKNRIRTKPTLPLSLLSSNPTPHAQNAPVGRIRVRAPLPQRSYPFPPSPSSNIALPPRLEHFDTGPGDHGGVIGAEMGRGEGEMDGGVAFGGEEGGETGVRAEGFSWGCPQRGEGGGKWDFLHGSQILVRGHSAADHQGVDRVRLRFCSLVGARR